MDLDASYCLIKHHTKEINMTYTLEQLQRKKTPIYSLKAPLSLAKRESGLETHQIYRNEFMRDRDRVLYSKAFRRLAGKTQVFLSGVDDHRRTRLTHTLEVSQIARSIAASLRLDTDLVEAIALGHDLGHTPFGHVGERTLHEIMTPQVQHILGETCPLNLLEKDEKISEELVLHLGFKHNTQSLKAAMKLEKNYGNNGLDLTNFTLYGIQAHSSTQYKQGRISNYDKLSYYDSFKKSGCMLKNGQFAWSLESFVVAEADEIAQRHHDVEDAIIGNLVSREEIISIIQLHFNKHLSANDKRMLKQSKELDEETFIATISRIIVNMYVSKLIKASVFNINTYIFQENIKQTSFAEYLKAHSPNHTSIKSIISYNTQAEDNEFAEQSKKFERTITDRVLSSYDIQTADAKGKYIIRKIFQAYYATPQQLPNHCVYEFLEAYDPVKYAQSELLKMAKSDGIGKVRSIFSVVISNFQSEDINAKMILMRIICDYIAGMTDTFAQKTYEELYG